MLDIVIPKGNEEELCETGKKLGFKGMVFLYKESKDVPSSLPKSMPCCILLAKKAKSYPWAIFSSENDRQLMEGRESPDIIIGSEWQEVGDKLHQRVSGLNHLLCRIAAEKGITIAPSLAKFWSSPPFQRAVALGRLSQNIMLCRKYKCRMAIASFAEDRLQMRNAQDMASFAVEAGMRQDEAKKSLIRQYPLR